MSGSRRSVLLATAAVFTGGRRVGSAVLVDDRHLLTARHVLLHLDLESGVKTSVQRVELEFPAAAVGSAGSVTASPIDLGSGGDVVDVAVLELADPLPEALPAPVKLWPAARLPERVAVFGYPLAEGALNGVWREFTVAGPTAAGAVQLDWTGDAGTFPGHSGGPVVDPASWALVGVLIEGARQGRFDRFLPVTSIGQLWPALPQPWLMAGVDGQSHFTRRARGQRSRARGGDIFRGRQTALTVARAWLTDTESPGLPLVITGQPGAGKSAVLARAVLGLQTERLGPGLAFHGRGATHTDLLAAVAELSGIDRVESPDALLDALADAIPDRPWRIAWDALDEAATAQDRQQIAETLTELAALPGIRVAVATRPLAATNRERHLPGGLLFTLGVTTPDGPNLVDLDTDRYFDPAGLEQFTAALLAQDGFDRPGPAGRAWTHYRTHPEVRGRTARVVAGRAGRNYLVAAMAAVPLSVSFAPVDPADSGFDERTIPSGVGEALQKYLDTPGVDEAWTRGLLTALAYARGAGIHDQLWLGFAAALGYPATVIDLDRLRASTAADYLLQTRPGDGGAVTRLFHQALTDELLTHRPDHRIDERRLFQALLGEVTAMGGWTEADEYARRHAGEHAAAAGELPRLLEDPHYLAVADFPHLLPLLAQAATELASDPTAMVLRRVGVRATTLPPARRARLLALTAAHLGLPDTCRWFASACTDGILPRWAHTLGSTHQELTGHTDEVYAVALGRIGDREVIVSGSRDRTVRIWDAAAGQPVGNPLTGHTDAVRAVALGRIGDREVIVSGGWDRTVRIWDARTGQPVGAPLTGHDGGVAAVALGRIAEREVIISGGQDAMVRIWDAGTGHLIGASVTGSYRKVDVVALGRIGGREVIVSDTGEISDAGTGQPLGAGYIGYVTAVALGRIGDRDVIISGGHDGTVGIWDASTVQPVGAPLTGHGSWVAAVALGWLGDREVIVSGSGDCTVRIWDAGTGHLVGAPLIGHTNVVLAVTMGRVADREVIVSGSRDGTVRIWDAGGHSIGTPLPGHTASVLAVATGRVADREVIVSGSGDGTVRIWDAGTGQPVGTPLTGHSDGVWAVALGRVEDRDVIVSGSPDSTVRIWDAGTGQPLGSPLTGHEGTVVAVALGRVGHRYVIVSGGVDHTVRIWDADTGHPVGAPLTGHTRIVQAVALGRARDRDVIVSGSQDGTVRIWDAGTGQPLGGPLTGHRGIVEAVVLGRIDDREVIVSGGWDGTVRVWDAGTGHPVGAPLTGHSGIVEAVVLGRIGGREVIVSGGYDQTVRIWGDGGTLVAIVDVLAKAGAVGMAPDGILCVATDRALCTCTTPT